MRAAVGWIALGVSAATAALVATPQARADDAPPAAIAQYVEIIPTGGGSAAIPRRKIVRTLAPSTSKQLATQGGTLAGVLRKAATDASYGAQPVARPLRREPSPGHQGRARMDLGLRVAAVDSSAAGAIGGWAKTWRGMLVVLVVGIAIGVVSVRAATRVRAIRRS